jgi:FAD/FMN-containing dehydrogenase
VLQLAEARRLNAEMVKKALALEGTCTGEHGVGVGKIKYLEGKHTPRQQKKLRVHSQDKADKGGARQCSIGTKS